LFVLYPPVLAGLMWSNNRYSGFTLILNYHHKGIILVELMIIMSLKGITIMNSVELGYKVMKGTE